MNLSIVNRSRSEISKPFIKSWVLKLSKHVPELKHYSELTLAFVSSAEMKSINSQYRGKDYATDVLSFQAVDFSAISKGEGERSKGERSKGGRAKGGSLGELVLCLSVIRRQAKSHGLTLEQELGYMIIHGILHLLGYEHENGSAKAKKMFKLQDETFSKMIKGRR